MTVIHRAPRLCRDADIAFGGGPSEFLDPSASAIAAAIPAPAKCLEIREAIGLADRSVFVSPGEPPVEIRTPVACSKAVVPAADTATSS